MIKTTQRVHFIGIGGIGMSGLAEILHRQGHVVTGSDRHTSNLTRHLVSMGIPVHEGHDASYVDCDLVVYTSAVHEDNPELSAALARGIPCIKRAELLGELTRRKQTIAVSGTHGKTTTSAMIAHLLVQADFDPSIFVGGILHNLETNARYTNSPWAVAEADEFDRSFMQLWPYVTVVTNVEADHLDCYRDQGDIEESFVRFVNQTSPFGHVFLCADDPGCARIRPRIRRRVSTFGLSDDASLRAVQVTQDGFRLSFDVIMDGIPMGSVVLPMSGLHNVRNALAALAAGHFLGMVFPVMIEALSSFKGTGRRFEILGTTRGVTFVDDYAHHPTEIRATLEGARLGWPDQRIVAVFQPHLYSRTRDFFYDFARSFGSADCVWLTDIYAAREQPIPDVTGDALFRELKKHHDDVQYCATIDQLTSELRRHVRQGDLVITLGAGDITHVGRRLFDLLSEAA